MSSYYEKFLATGEVKCIDEEIPFEIPATWEWCRLGGVIQLLSGRDLEPYHYNSDGIGIPYMTGASNFCHEELIVNRWTEVPVTVSHIGDLLITCKGTIGTMAFNNIGDIHIARQIMGISSSYVSLKYIKLCLEIHVAELQKAARSIIPGISRDDMLYAVIPLPPIEEQHRIVSKIREVLTYVERYTHSQTALHLLNESIKPLLRKSILQEAIQGRLVSQDSSDESVNDLLQHIKEEKQRLVKEGKLKKSALADSVIFRSDDNKYYERIGSDIYDITDNIPFDIPANWNWCRLKDVVSIFTGATFKKEDTSTGSKGVRVLRGGNISPFELVMKPDDLFLPYTKIKESILLRKNDIVTPAVTSLENIGKAARVQKDLNDVTVGGFVFILRSFLCNDLLSQYLLALLGSPSMGEYMKSVTNKSGQAFYNIGKERLAMAMIPLPPIKEQQRIVAQIEKLFEQLI